MIKYSKFFKTPLKFKHVIGSPKNTVKNFADNMIGKWVGGKSSPFKLESPGKPNPSSASKTWPMK